MLRKNKNNREILPWLYNLPALTIIILVLLVPIISTVVISLTNMSIYNWKAYDFIGLGNYKNALNVLDSGFLEALVITVIWTIITMVIQLLIAFVIALGLNSKYLLGKTFFKTLGNWNTDFTAGPGVNLDKFLKEIDIELPLGINIEYKVIKKDSSGKVSWENIQNRSIKITNDVDVITIEWNKYRR